MAHQKSAFGVDRHHGVPARFEVRRRIDGTWCNAGRVHQNVQAAKPRDCFLNDVFSVGTLGDIRGDRFYIAAAAADLFGKDIQSVLIHVRSDDNRPFFQEPEHGGAADSRCRAGDDSDLVF